ncbi:right-handed parallel beta-helix repeat-containing protein [Roseateles saccharophilus]|uniref:Parallel beta helix pectate lyase-like protein n=1 Tax=Roseateles saccharophilus TaxID=304 RepID=A0A4R3VKH3_ROSSA|nr:right-handed parallel beta-helix repeat-containing protein [Roseateles saccharophilus]MDG0831247.1 right-handed parallel beta-helix repeat-containing protein [Roseateles saccharophilus]TCV04368.1 hypothetical protein EV671_1001123 [Roseateles saccharophilus]
MHAERSLVRVARRGLLLGALLLAAPLALAVDGAILINQARALAGGVSAGDAPGFPVSINTPGYYVLTSNLTVPNSSTTAIQINANNVTIDLNGFAILGPNVCATDGFTVAQPCTQPSGSPYAGVGVDAGTAVAFNVNNTRIINGTIDGMGGIGVFANVNARIEKLNITNCGSYGIYTFGGVILDTLVRGNGNTGILTTGAVIRDSRSVFNRGTGIQTGAASSLSGNIVSTNLGYGLLLSGNSRFADNVIDNNNGGNANPQISGGTAAGVNTCGTAACP